MVSGTTQSNPMNYKLELKTTEAATGFFACEPDPDLDIDEALSYLREQPFDTFMYRYTLELISRLPEKELQVLENKHGNRNSTLNALILETAIIKANPLSLSQDTKAEIKDLAAASPMITLRAIAQPDYLHHRQWNELFRANLAEHRGLPSPHTAPQPFPYEAEEVADPGGVYISQILSRDSDEPSASEQRPSPGETAQLALEKLRSIDILEGSEMRHESSLSPFGLLHKWRLDLRVECSRHNYRLSGLQTSYGKGLTLDSARASYTMEIVERCSSFANIHKDHVSGCVQEHILVQGSHSSLKKETVPSIDPNILGSDVPYNDEPLHWIQGQQQTEEGFKTVLVPLQSIFLFCNLDEIDLYAGHGSTGLASGNTMEEARLSALMELVERDGEATHPFHNSTCFNIQAKDAKVAALLDDYRSRGIQFQFQDISPPYGIPCCKCYVTDMDGHIAKGAAAGLNGRRAVVSALTETPYPYPYGPPSGPGMEQLPLLYFEDLPDFSSGSLTKDLAVTEKLLMANGLFPIYVDLTRKDLGIPVVRALLPGVALTADLDEHARVHPRLFGNYLSLYDSED